MALDEETSKAVAAQLRKPEGEYAIEIANRMNVGNKAINQLCIEKLPLVSGSKILEIGMGNGKFIQDLFDLQNDILYTGYDYSKDMIEQASLNNAKRIDEGSVSFVFGTILDMPFETESFDTIFTVNTLYFWDQYQRALVQLHRVLKPEGRLLVAIRSEETMKNFPFSKYGFNMFNKAKLEALFDDSSLFELLETIEKKDEDREISGQMLEVDCLITIAKKK